MRVVLLKQTDMSWPAALIRTPTHTRDFSHELVGNIVSIYRNVYVVA